MKIADMLQILKIRGCRDYLRKKRRFQRFVSSRTDDMIDAAKKLGEDPGFGHDHNLGPKKSSGRVNMTKKSFILFLILMLGFFLHMLKAETRIEMKMRFFEGMREGQSEPPNVSLF